MANDGYPDFTPELLKHYSYAAFQNALELRVEAELLIQHGHFARAYFLGVAAIEEAGKALQAFDAQHRNLSNPAVRAKLRQGMENHDQKINYAMLKWALASEKPREAVVTALNLMAQLRRGREAAMYSEALPDPSFARRPKDVVREVAARDCVRLAGNCIANAGKYLNDGKPQQITAKDDRLFTMKSAKFFAISTNVDFWRFWLTRHESGSPEFSAAVLEYERLHHDTGMPFQQEPPADESPRAAVLPD